MSYNRAILIGNLCNDPELRRTPNGVSVCTFTIAVDRAYSKDGQKESDYISIVAWRERAEFTCKNFHKGKLILVEGSIQTRNYTDKNDQKRTAVEVVAENVRFVGSKADSPGGNSRPAPEPDHSSGGESFEEIENDDSLPF